MTVVGDYLVQFTEGPEPPPAVPPSGYRSVWADEILAGRSVVQCALDVHSATTGASERSRAAQHADVCVLAETLARWRPTAAAASVRFDAAVRELICAALAELPEGAYASPR